MRKCFKGLALALVLALALALLPTAALAATPTPTPSTETPSSWAVETVNRAISAGLVPSNLQSRYAQPITRSEFCALATALYEKATGAAITGRTQFNDTTDVNVEKMASLNVVTGTGNGNFSPDNPLTREQAATMLARLANALGKPMTAQAPSFNDASVISTWAADAVGQVQGAKIMGDVGNGNFNPAGSYTREQSIVTMSRTLDLVTAADGTAAREARLYQLLLEGIRDKKGLDGTSYIDLSALGLSNEDGSPDRDMLWTVFDRVFYDHPELYYLQEGYNRVSGNTSNVLGIRPMYASVAEDVDAQARFDIAVNTALAQIEGLTDPVEQMLALYQYLIRTTDYNYDVAVDQRDNAPKEAWTAYGALVTGDTVCKGYAMAWKVLMDRIEIPCLVVCKGDKSHLWNMVQLDGKWYHVDVNKGNNNIPVLQGRCAYTDFLVTDDAMSKHESWYVPGTSYRDVDHYDTFPACTDEKFSTGWLFRQDGMFYPMYRNKSGQYYYVRQINTKKAKLCCGPLLGTGKELADLSPYTVPWGNGYRISSGMVWVEDCLYYVNVDLELMRYRLSDGESVSLGDIPFTPQATADQHFDQRYDGVSLVFDAHSGVLSARSRNRGTDLKTWQITQPQA